MTYGSTARLKQHGTRKLKTMLQLTPGSEAMKRWSAQELIYCSSGMGSYRGSTCPYAKMHLRSPWPLVCFFRQRSSRSGRTRSGGHLDEKGSTKLVQIWSAIHDARGHSAPCAGWPTHWPWTGSTATLYRVNNLCKVAPLSPCGRSHPVQALRHLAAAQLQINTASKKSRCVPKFYIEHRCACWGFSSHQRRVSSCMEGLNWGEFVSRSDSCARENWNVCKRSAPYR